MASRGGVWRMPAALRDGVGKGSVGAEEIYLWLRDTSPPPPPGQTHADGRQQGIIGHILNGGPCSWFLSPSNPVTARKKWIAGSLEPRGAVTVDAGAAKAMLAGKSLLPAGVVKIDGQFSRGDCVIIRNMDETELGRGLIAYDSPHAQVLVGRKSGEIEALLGAPGRAEMIHRDDMVLAGYDA